MKVCKFGGSSLADAEQFKKVKNIVLSDDARSFVVPSAPGKRYKTDIKVTDLLYACYDKSVRGMSFENEFNMISERFNEIKNQLSLTLDIDYELEKIKNEIPLKNRDYASSRGEYLNGKLLAEYLGFEFVDSFDIMIFDYEGVLLDDKTRRAVRKRLENVEKAVIPGFYGRDMGNNVRTFSRGGSDITGSLIAYALGADIYENWTDVSGFLLADPRIVENPVGIETVSYSELRELSYMGANVLHEEATFPVRKAGIPINVRNTNRPEDMGTMIVPDNAARESTFALTGISGKKDFAIVTITKERMNSDLGFARRALHVFEALSIPIEHMPAGIDTLSVVIHQNDLREKRDMLITEIKRTLGAVELFFTENISLIAVVGRTMSRDISSSARMFTALASKHIDLKLIDQGSSISSIIIGVDNDNFEPAINAIYGEFFR